MPPYCHATVRKPLNRTQLSIVLLDTDRIAEGLSLVLQDDGPHGILVGTPADGIFLGTAPAGHAWTGLEEEFQGLPARRDGEIVHQLNLAAGN